MQGFGLIKPHGYAGDFEMIDRIYTRWVSPHPARANWDHFFHAQHAPRAVRNRKDYFIQCVRSAARQKTNGPLRVLNVGAGPARDVFELLSAEYPADVTIDCIDLDDLAIAYASRLCQRHLNRVRFFRQNVVRLRLEDRYDMIWSAGLFDYLSDRLFSLALRRLFSHLVPGGELIVGNFSLENPSRVWMEAVGDWRLEHRSREQLLRLAKEAGIPNGLATVRSEPLGVNLFLHARRDSDRARRERATI